MSEDNSALDELLTCDADALAQRLESMTITEAEQYARAILDKIGGPTFERYLQCIADVMVPPDGLVPETGLDDYFHAVRSLFPHIEADDGTLGRLCAIVVHLCRTHLRDENVQ